MPLSDVRVIDCGQAIAGPICATYLSDLGADVIKVEHPRLGRLSVTDTPLDLSETPVREPEHAPVLGEHNAEVLGELGYDEEEVAEFVAAGVLSGREGWVGE